MARDKSSTAAVVKAGASVRVDSFMNNLTGLGIKGRDKRLGAVIAPPDRLDPQSLEMLYAADAIAAKIVDMLPEDMCREWIDYSQDSDPDGTTEALVMQWLREIKAQEMLEWALKMANLHGGAVVVLGVDDGKEFDQPLNMNGIRSLAFLNVLDRWQIYPTTQVYRDPTKAKYGTPELYRLAPARHSEATGKIIHESRLLRFDGSKMPDRYSLNNWGWGDPILNRLVNSIRAYHTAHDSVAVIINDFTQGVYKFKGLADMLLGVGAGPGGLDDLKARMQAVELGRSLLNALVLDEDEDFSKLSTTVTGIADLLSAIERRLAAETRLPHTRLFNESPGASLGEGGIGQTRDWYDAVSAKQEATLRGPIERILDIGLRAKTGPTKGAVPANWSVGFKSLWQQDEKEMASNRFMQAQADALYIGNGTLTPAEVATSRFAGSGFSFDTTLDKNFRDEMDSDPDAGEAPDV